MKHRLVLACVMMAAFAATAGIATAAVIVAPVAGVINSGGPGFGSLADTFNQNGLSSGYVSGVTDFDVYLGTNPTHTTTFGGFEWFSNSGTSSASVTYDLGSVMQIDRLALWNEESSGIGSLDLYGSTDNVTFNLIVSGLLPTDHALVNYGADVFNLGATNARYVRFDMSGCPQPNNGTFNACAIGEVAFSSGGAGAIPEPGTAVLLGLGIAGLGLIRRKRAN
ncbi:MAG: coagulation factor 5/8 type domain-containing protein [Candidatus Solibacter sp.]|nr:coagulation factor 5/8 type domain-containing protein [Candidatus Solibacter sp.]